MLQVESYRYLRQVWQNGDIIDDRYRISASLRRLFEEHRIVFWYNTVGRDMRDEFEALDLR